MAKNTSRNIGFALLLIAMLATIILSHIQYKYNHRNHNPTVYSNTSKPPAIYPSYPLNNSIIPPDMAAPTFRWSSKPLPGFFKIELKSKNEKLFSGFVDQLFWKPDSTLWETTKQKLTNNHLTFTVGFLHNTDSTSYNVSDSINFTISIDSVKAPIFFRHLDIPLSYVSRRLSTVEWCLGNISHYKPAKVLMTGSNTCGNCHSFSLDGQTMGIDFDYKNDKGGYAVFPVENITRIDKKHFYSWNSLSENSEKSTGLLSAISPNGRYVASTVNDKSLNWFNNDEFRFYPVKGQIGIYDTQTGESFLLPGASDTAFVQCNPTWSPDGKSIVFAKAKKMHESILNNIDEKMPYIKGEKDYKYDLWSIAFNNGKGGTPTPIKGASNNNKSNYFAKVSPDGKWIVFCQAHSYMLRQRDSKLAIVPFAGGDTRLLECNTHNMNSWHSWSPNGRWLIFSTKALSTYTKIAITHIDDEGHASPPIIIENMSHPKRAANIPEFINIDYNEWNNVELTFNQATLFNDINLKNLPNGEYIGTSTVTNNLLKPLTITARVKIVKNKINIISIIDNGIETNKINPLIEKIIYTQSINPNIIKPATATEKASLLAIANALNAH